MNSDEPLIILVDYRGAFNWKFSNAKYFGSFDLRLLERAFAEYECVIELRTITSLDFRNENFNGQWVLLTSSEDPNLLYKSYIEDVSLALAIQGAKLVPRFEHLRAHHNKVFGELMRDVLGGAALHSVSARVFGTYEDFLHKKLAYPRVFKMSGGFGSKGVKLAVDSKGGRKVASRLSKSIFLQESFKEVIKRILRRKYIPRSLHRQKFICQTFVSNLDGDYKILVYGEKYYCLSRTNRPNDFRASGSGSFSFPTTVAEELLDFASEVFQRFDCPCASLDIAHDGNHFHLLEFQFICFGTFAIENAPHYYKQTPSGWKMIAGKTIVEEEFALSVVEFIRGKTYVHNPYTVSSNG